MKIKNIPWRIKALITRKVVWVDTRTGEEFHTRESFGLIWAIAGIHSHHWWWVRKYGKLSCGCTRNPLTRRMVMYSGECVKWNRHR